MSQAVLPQKLGIIAGGGHVPDLVLSSCDALGIDVFIVALKGHASEKTVEGRNHTWVRLGQASKIIKAFKNNDVGDLVMIGSVRRPSVAELVPDAKALEFLAKAGKKALSGDDDMLSALKLFLQGEGFQLHGAHKFAKDLLAPLGVIGKISPGLKDLDNIECGYRISQTLGELDVGQSVVVQDGLILGVEAIEGTDNLIKRTASLARKGAKPILVKTCKPQQDTDLDLPTIGVRTLENLKTAGFSGVAVHAGKALIVKRDEVISFANKNKMFIYGIDK